jgi:hypothetical protein
MAWRPFAMLSPHQAQLTKDQSNNNGNGDRTCEEFAVGCEVDGLGLDRFDSAFGSLQHRPDSGCKSGTGGYDV